MRFRAPNMTQGGAQSLTGGIGDVFRNIAMAPFYEMQAAQQYQDAEASRLLRDAQRQKLEFDMQAARQKQAADAAEAAAQAERTSIGSLIANGARISGVPEAQVHEFSQYLQTGRMPGRYGDQAGSNMLGAVRQAPGDGMGPVQPVPSFYGDNTGQRVMRQAGLAGQALAIGDKSTENIAKASDIYGNQALRDAILSGDRSAGEVGQAQAAIAGKPLVQNIGDTGIGFNQFTGARQQLDPGLVAIFGEKAAAEVAARQAQAGASRASAASSYASAAKTRADAQRDAKSGDISVVQAPDGSVQLVNKVTGLSRPAVGMDGKPVMKGGGAGAKMPAEVQRMNIALRALDEGLNSYEALLKDFNPRNPAAQINPETRARAESLLADLQLQLKEAQALGALTGPDVEILNRALANPVSLKGAMYGRGGLSEQLSQTRQALQRRKNALAAEFNKPELAGQGVAAATKRIRLDAEGNVIP